MEIAVGRTHHFSTAPYTTRDRTRVWQDHIDESLFPTADYTPLNSDGLLARHSMSTVDETRVHGFFLNGHVVDRVARNAGAPGEAIFCKVVVAGGVSYSSASSMHVAGPGDVLFYDPQDPFFIGFRPGTAEILLEIPRILVPSDLFSNGESCIRIREGYEGGANLGLDEYRVLLQSLTTAGGVTSDFENRVRVIAKALTGIVAGNGARSLFLEAVRLIEQQAHDHELTTNRIALELSMSARQLNRIFQAHGTTAAACIARERIQRAKAMLTATSASMTRIALYCGFGTSSNFSRSFSRSTGFSPLAYRKAHD
ncbi:helix-turn-helix domain-containing protein [Arthrobacter sp. Bi83]|uniref:helix-turn-helix domain-containing protein n=1 Tax=Arthrobacter sp. Bi83 TaxID=2822353 RepID=UPI001E3A6971|nr:helix-turn-helix domain-containing protein [Arthrobacter sp. Bi83]